MRINKLKAQFQANFGLKPEVVVNAPGRAEIIGNHTDYNLGHALGCAISQSTMGLFKKRNDDKIVIYSTLKDLTNPLVEFHLNDLHRDQKIRWGNYARAVAKELQQINYPLTGANILVDTDFSTAGGLSSSAALELCLAYGLLSLSGQSINPEVVALACQRAENSDLVQSPCGFLDQGVITFAQAGKMVLLDFSPPVKTTLIPADLNAQGVCLVVAVDKTVKRVLGESGFPARRKTCEDACRFLKISSLRQLTPKNFETKKNQLQPTMRNRVEHFVYENQRVLSAAHALQNKDMIKFGQLLNQSGKSALDLYDLDENTPELRHLMETAQNFPGVLGARNMGGGFSAIILALVNKKSLSQFISKLEPQYQKRFPGKLEFFQFTPCQGVEVIS
jgi:galactokinase